MTCCRNENPEVVAVWCYCRKLNVHMFGDKLNKNEIYNCTVALYVLQLIAFIFRGKTCLLFIIVIKEMYD